MFPITRCAVTASCCSHVDAARRRVARGTVERVVQANTVVHAPAEVLVEGRGALEHLGLHVDDACRPRQSLSLVEGEARRLEHLVPVPDLVLDAQPPMSWLKVEEPQMFIAEHPHVRVLREVPRADVLVKLETEANMERHRRDGQRCPTTLMFPVVQSQDPRSGESRSHVALLSGRIVSRN